MSGDQSLIAEVRTRMPGSLFRHTTTEVPEAVIEPKYTAATDQDVPYLFYEVRCEDFAAFDAALAEDPTIADPTVVVDNTASGRRLYRIKPDAVTLVIPELIERGGALLSGYCQDGVWTSRLQFPNTTTLTEFRAFCKEQDSSFEVRKLYRATDSDSEYGDVGLTDRQRTTLLAAWEAGYFEEPRRASLEDLAADLDISPTAVGGRIRRGVATMVENVLVQPD